MNNTSFTSRHPTDCLTFWIVDRPTEGSLMLQYLTVMGKNQQIFRWGGSIHPQHQSKRQYPLLIENTDISSYFWDWFNKNILHLKFVGVYKACKCGNHQWSSPTYLPAKGLFRLKYIAVLWTPQFTATWYDHITGRYHSGCFYPRYICSEH